MLKPNLGNLKQNWSKNSQNCNKNKQKQQNTTKLNSKNRNYKEKWNKYKNNETISKVIQTTLNNVKVVEVVEALQYINSNNPLPAQF